MRESRTCPKCRSTDVIEQARVVDRSDGGTRDLSIRFPGPTVAGLFRVPQDVPLSAWVCARCGYTELYASQPEQIRSLRERVAAEGRASAWEMPPVGGEGQTRSRRLVLLALAAALIVGGALLVLLVLFVTAPK